MEQQTTEIRLRKVPADLKQWLDQAAEAENIKTSVYVLEALEEKRQREHKAKVDTFFDSVRALKAQHKDMAFMTEEELASLMRDIREDTW